MLWKDVLNEQEGELFGVHSFVTRNKVGIFGESFNYNLYIIEVDHYWRIVREREFDNEVHGDECSWSGRRFYRMKLTKDFMSSHFVPNTRVAGSNIIVDKVLHFGPVVGSSHHFKSLVKSKVTSSWWIMKGFLDEEFERVVVRNIYKAVEKENLLFRILRVGGMFRHYRGVVCFELLKEWLCWRAFSLSLSNLVE